jgi:putative addiction module component (TIGR02574 family)
MSNITYDEIFGVVLTLPPLYKAMLADHLLNSLDQVDPEIELAWKTEIENRIEGINEGKVSLIPADQVLKKLRNR